MIGPILLSEGSEAQKAEHLPKIASGEIRWCQGYSEPGAGSDLANLQCKAVREGESYLVNGQKIWTSHADKSDWIFCLVRTRFEGKKQGGISFLLIDLKTEGVEVKPSVLHGDLWSGNVAAVEGEPCIFDPATYYGHHEAEWGMSWCASLGPAFWKGYRELIPKDEGFERRFALYEAYHQLNHYNFLPPKSGTPNEPRQ